MVYRGHVKNGQITLDEPARLPEGAAVNVSVLEGSDGNSVAPRDRREILRMPVDQRRQLLMEQSERLASHYGPDADRLDWQGGDIVE
jgi:hypothetical protein